MSSTSSSFKVISDRQQLISLLCYLLQDLLPIALSNVADNPGFVLKVSPSDTVRDGIRVHHHGMRFASHSLPSSTLFTATSLSSGFVSECRHRRERDPDGEAGGASDGIG